MTAFCGALPCVTLTADDSSDKSTEQIRIVVIRSAKVGDLEVSEGDMVAVTPFDEDSGDEAGLQFCMVQAVWQTQKAKMMQVSLQCNLLSPTWRHFLTYPVLAAWSRGLTPVCAACQPDRTSLNVLFRLEEVFALCASHESTASPALKQMCCVCRCAYSCGELRRSSAMQPTQRSCLRQQTLRQGEAPGNTRSI